MKIIVCVDNKNGMLFNGRRQSSDRIVCERVLKHTQNTGLWMNRYSAKLFKDPPYYLTVAEDFLDRCPADQWCFVENTDISQYRHKIRQVLLYRWNRTYPSDVTLPCLGLNEPDKVSEFAGNSHDLITEELYIL